MRKITSALRPSPSHACVLVCLAIGAVATAAGAQPFPPPGYPPVQYGPGGEPTAICVPRYDSAGNLTGWKYACGADTPACRSAQQWTLDGGRLFRVGSFGTPGREGSCAGEGQYWFPPAHHPLRLDPQRDLGFPPSKGPADFLCTGTMQPGGPFVVRPYALGNGRYNFMMGEVICPSGGVRLETFHTGVVPHEDDALDYCGPGRRFGRPATSRLPPACPPSGGCPTPPPPSRFGWLRPSGPMDGNQMCNGAMGMGVFGPVAYMGGGMTLNGLANCANDNPIGIVEATGGTWIMTAGGSLFLTNAGTFATGAGYFGTGATLTSAGGTLATAAWPATACVAVATVSYCGTRAVDNACGGRISDGVATGMCATYDTFANVCWRWWAPGCEWNYDLTRTSASMYGEGARRTLRGPSRVCGGGNVMGGGVDPPYRERKPVVHAGCSVVAPRPAGSWGIPIAAALLAGALARRRRRGSRSMRC